MCYMTIVNSDLHTEKTHKFNTANNTVQNIELRFFDVSMSSGSLCVAHWAKGLFVQCKMLWFLSLYSLELSKKIVRWIW